MFRCGVLRVKVPFIPENTKCFSAEGEAPEKGGALLRAAQTRSAACTPTLTCGWRLIAHLEHE